MKQQSHYFRRFFGEKDADMEDKTTTHENQNCGAYHRQRIAFRLPFRAKRNLIILDPPCTGGTGIFAKQPSAKWRITQRSISKMADIQWQMINKCAEKVAAGGVMIYSTCSITVEENEMIVERFLKDHAEFTWQKSSPTWGCQDCVG